MRLQLAVDRVTVEQGIAMCRPCAAWADIIEVGTSLIKEYGSAAIAAFARAFPDKEILADIKTMDEGAYEFRAAFAAGAGWATVMGAAAPATVELCAAAAQKAGRQCMVDVMECSPQRVAALAHLQQAVFCLHPPVDTKADLASLILHARENYPGLHRLALAGGVTEACMPLLRGQGFEVAVVGSAVWKAEDPAAMARRFWLAAHAQEGRNDE